MRILAVSRRTPETSIERLRALQEPEAAVVWRLVRQDFVRDIWFDRARPAAVLMLEAESMAAAEARLAELPMVAERQIAFDFFALEPFAQLENLFAPQHRTP